MAEAIYPVPAAWSQDALIDGARYDAMYRRSVEEPEAFWAEEGRRLDWIRPFTKVKNTSFHEADFGIRWFEDGTLNLSANCLDRHLATRGDDVAILWEPDSPDDASRAITYRELHAQVCRLANLLKERGVKRGERVTIYLPMVPEAAVAMLACARIGAIHSIVFAGFSPDALAGRIEDCDSRVVLTADEGLRGGKRVPLKKNVDEALTHCPGVDTVVVLARTGANVPMVEGRDLAWAEAVGRQSEACEPEEMNAEDPLFILYTSGSTGKPKGVLHTTGGYAVWASMTHEYVFDYRPGQIYWCAADIGWVTGHSYIVYGPLANGATTVMFEGVPNYPDASRFWQVVDKYKVEIFYGAPTALRALMREGDEWVKKTSRASLRVLGSVGEPINPEAWEWYHKVVGEGRCPIVDTWWQTETGGAMITPCPAPPRSSPVRPAARCSAWPRPCSTTTARFSKGRPMAASSSPTAGRARCAPSGATTSASSRPISPRSRAITLPAMAAAATRTAITGSPAASTT
jgi:acetyl-CoA synthetase